MPSTSRAFCVTLAVYLACMAAAALVDATSVLTLTDTTTLNSGDGPLYGMCMPPGATYFLGVARKSPARVTKIQISDNTRLGSLTFNSGENYAQSCTANADHAFVVTETSPTVIIKVAHAGENMTRVGSITLGSDYKRSFHSIMSYDLATIYVSHYGNGMSDGRIAKIDVASFQFTAGVYLGDNNGPAFKPLCQDFTYLYTAAWNSQNLCRIRKSDLDVTCASILKSSHSGAASISEDHTKAYVISQSTGVVNKVDLATMTRDSDITLSLSTVQSSLISGDSLLVAGAGGNVAVVDISSGAFNYSSTLTLGSGGLYSCLNTSSNVAFFGNGAYPPQSYKTALGPATTTSTTTTSTTTTSTTTTSPTTTSTTSSTTTTTTTTPGGSNTSSSDDDSNAGAIAGGVAGGVVGVGLTAGVIFWVVTTGASAAAVTAAATKAAATSESSSAAPADEKMAAPKEMTAVEPFSPTMP